jgi:hypothetical protein
MALLRASRAAQRLSKLATEGVAAFNPYGTEGRLQKPPVPLARLKKVQGPRQHAPRISAPSP